MNSQEAITLLGNLEDALDSYCELNEEGKTAFRMAITALNCSEIPNNWIPCSERLPEPRIDVWCNSDMGQMVGFYDETTENWYKSDYSFELIVDAWMPLPSLYREEADE